MSQKTGQFWIRNHMKTDVVRTFISPESGCCLFCIAYAVIGDDYIHNMLSTCKMPDDIGGVLLHASQHKRVNAVRSQYNVQSACKLPQF